MRRTGDLARIGRTAVQLHPGQIAHRVRLRSQISALRWCRPAGRWLLAGPDPADAAGWPAGYAPLDARVWGGWPGTARLHDGEMCLLGHGRPLTPDRAKEGTGWSTADWAMTSAPLLWRYHLYYWDWAWGMATERKREDARALFALMWASWHAADTPGQGPAWHPYPASLRAWSFCGIYSALAAGSEVEAAFRADLAVHAGFLRRHLETDVGGNHLIKNLKALAGLAVFFTDDALLKRTLHRLSAQLPIQVLPDGGHYERAPAYHCQVLGDLIDVDGLLRAAGREVPAELPVTIGKMRKWLGAILTPAGDVPLLNDGFPVSRELLAGVHAADPPGAALLLLPDTGLARAAAGPWHLLADVGLPCPPELPAHAHADTLGCILSVDKEPLLVDTGTSSYAAGQVRDYERSTGAHNTLELDHQDSTEVWGTFRAGRRARVTGMAAVADAGVVTIEGTHDGYRSLRGRPRHHRRWSLTEAGLRVDDQVTGRGRHVVIVRWHLAPGARLQLIPGGAVVRTPAGEFHVTVTATSEPALMAATGEIGAGFGRTEQIPVLACTLQATLPMQISTVWRRTGRGQEPA